MTWNFKQIWRHFFVLKKCVFVKQQLHLLISGDKIEKFPYFLPILDTWNHDQNRKGRFWHIPGYYGGFNWFLVDIQAGDLDCLTALNKKPTLRGKLAGYRFIIQSYFFCRVVGGSEKLEIVTPEEIITVATGNDTY